MAETIEHSAAARASLIGLSLEEMTAQLEALGLERFRAKQLWQWMYVRGVTDFAAMTNIAKPVREQLASQFAVPRAEVLRDLTSEDGTRKWLLGMEDAHKIETVFIPEAPRGTLCISSQVGCTLACSFCHTGTMQLVRNLTAAEIVGQVMSARDGLGQWPTPVNGRGITNIVFMGMGEPLYNYDQVVKAVNLLTNAEGLGFSKRRVTLSTSGVVPRMADYARDCGTNLAISLHAVNDELRNELVPLNRKYPIAELMTACRDYAGVVKGRYLMFEYVMLNGVNDSDAEARELVRLLKDLPAKVNLIPFNPWPGTVYERSSNNRIRAFSNILSEANIATPVRTTRGDDIFAACGQLKSDSERKKGEKVKLHQS